MPKDAKKNVDRFKVRGGDLNEYDYAQNQEKLTNTSKQSKNSLSRLRSSKTASARKKSSKKRGVTY
jgi:hypothetical protein